jgi:hypothetical protein
LAHKLLIQNDKEWAINSQNNIDESQSRFARWKKAVKRNIYCMVLFILPSQKCKAKVTETGLGLHGNPLE